MPLWVWNDELEWSRLKEQLIQFKQQGMGGVFVHPRPGLMTEYLGAEWFRLWKLALEEGTGTQPNTGRRPPSAACGCGYTSR